MRKLLLTSLLMASCTLLAQNDRCKTLGSITKKVFLDQSKTRQSSAGNIIVFSLGGKTVSGTTIKNAIGSGESMTSFLTGNTTGQGGTPPSKYKNVREKVASECITGLVGNAMASLGTACGRACYLNNFSSGPGGNFGSAAGVNVDKINSKFFIYLKDDIYYCGIKTSDAVEAMTDPVAVSSGSWQTIWSGNTQRDYVRELNNGTLYTKSGQQSLPLKVYVRMKNSKDKTADILTASSNNYIFNKLVQAGSYGVASMSDKKYGCLYLVQERARNAGSSTYSPTKTGLEFVPISGANATCPGMEAIKSDEASFIGLPGLVSGEDYVVRTSAQMPNADIVRYEAQICSSGASSI